MRKGCAQTYEAPGKLSILRCRVYLYVSNCFVYCIRSQPASRMVPSQFKVPQQQQQQLPVCVMLWRLLQQMQSQDPSLDPSPSCAESVGMSWADLGSGPHRLQTPTKCKAIQVEAGKRCPGGGEEALCTPVRSMWGYEMISSPARSNFQSKTSR